MSTTIPTDEKNLPSAEKRIRSRSLKQNCTSEDSSSAIVPFTSLPTEIPFLNPEKHTETIPFRRFISTPNRIPLAQTLAHKKLRKYASEACFSLEDSSSSDLLPKEKEQKTAIGKHKIFSVQPVKTVDNRDTLLLPDGSVPSFQHTKRDDSEGEASYSGSDATLASTSMTPILRRKSWRSSLHRPKSSAFMYGTLFSSDMYNTPTSATLPSIDSLQHIGLGMSGNIEERRSSNFYDIDDDSLHEFDDEKGNNLFFKQFNIF
ncbi:unnamed protein product [Cercopithifilaria johnstoni]|uniref:Uncharacterized protein n=1 Tax=Cercopithifilaria johnstoni TaxID=2874296 RepID=A0A8J2LZX1_9BILA|nr:unnamed protein product [Cercopithifilaria johnstoni]